MTCPPWVQVDSMPETQSLMIEKMSDMYDVDGDGKFSRNEVWHSEWT